MYIGSTNEQGLHHLVNEVLDNSIDEVVAGHASEVSFHYKKDGSIKIKDNGRGIPIDFHPKFKNKRALEIVLSTLHAGGKFDNNSYKTSGGLHGVGISVVNALSSSLEVNVYKNSKKYSQLYSKGKPKTKIKITKCKKNEKGTEIIFTPDESIFETTQFSPKKLYDFIKMKAVLVSRTIIDFKIDNLSYRLPVFLIKKTIPEIISKEIVVSSLSFTRNLLQNKFFMSNNLKFPNSRVFLENYFK